MNLKHELMDLWWGKKKKKILIPGMTNDIWQYIIVGHSFGVALSLKEG